MTEEKEIPALSPANFEIMKLVWEHGEVTVNDVLEAVNQQREEKLRRTSVQVQMSRLEKYGWLHQRREGKRLYYSAARGRLETVGEIIEDVNARVFNGSATDMVKSLLDNNPASRQEIDNLRRLLDRYDRDKE